MNDREVQERKKYDLPGSTPMLLSFREYKQRVSAKEVRCSKEREG